MSRFGVNRQLSLDYLIGLHSCPLLGLLNEINKIEPTLDTERQIKILVQSAMENIRQSPTEQQLCHALRFSFGYAFQRFRLTNESKIQLLSLVLNKACKQSGWLIDFIKGYLTFSKENSLAENEAKGDASDLETMVK